MSPAQQTRIIFVRHAVVDNPDGIFYGRLPGFPLSALGRLQAEFLAGHSSTLELAAIYTSPRQRARETAAILATRHTDIEPQTLDDLDEVRSGWNGRPLREIPPGVNLYAPPRDPGDETIPEIAERMLACARRLRAQHPGQTVLCVSHGDPIACLAALLRSVPLEVWNIRGKHHAAPCSLTSLSFEPDAALPRMTYQDVISESRPELVAPRVSVSSSSQTTTAAASTPEKKDPPA